ncbi:MAG TPA: VOC family protein [Bauldia sp.]|nr:VOC family protein [Bauldia sp.]
MTTVLGLDHVQLLVSRGGEQQCRDFYLGVLGLTEIERPAAARGRAFLWVAAGRQQVHFRVDPDFRPSPIAHAAFLVDDLDALERTLIGVGFEPSRAQTATQGRFHVEDPFGNRLEFMQSGVQP